MLKMFFSEEERIFFLVKSSTRPFPKVITGKVPANSGNNHRTCKKEDRYIEVIAATKNTGCEQQCITGQKKTKDNTCFNVDDQHDQENPSDLDQLLRIEERSKKVGE